MGVLGLFNLKLWKLGPVCCSEMGNCLGAGDQILIFPICPCSSCSLWVFFCCSVLLQGQVYPESICLWVLHASGAAGAWGWKRSEGWGDYLWACSPSAQFQDTWKIRQLIAKPGVCLNTTQMLHNVYYLNFSILLERCPLGITGYKSVALRVHKGGNVPSGCCGPHWRLWAAECLLVCSVLVVFSLYSVVAVVTSDCGLWTCWLGVCLWRAGTQESKAGCQLVQLFYGGLHFYQENPNGLASGKRLKVCLAFLQVKRDHKSYLFGKPIVF